MRPLKQGTTVVVCGPFLTTNGITPDTDAVLSTAVVFLSKNHAAFAAKACTKASSGGARGNYRVFLTTVDSGTLGPLRLDFLDTDAFLNAHEDFFVMSSNAYNALTTGDYLHVDVIQINGTAQTTAVSVLSTGDIDGALAAGITTLSTDDLDGALAAGITTLSTGDLDAALTNWDKTGFALTTVANDLISSGVWEQITTEHNTTKTFGDEFQDLAAGAGLTTTQLDAGLTNWNKTGFALTTAQHVLIQAGLSTLSTGDLDDALTDWDKTGFALTTAQHDLIGGRVSTAKLDAAIICTLSTGDLDDALTNWDKTAFALTTAQHDLIGARVSTAKLDAAIISTLSTGDLDDALTNWNKTAFALTTAQHDLIGARVSTAKLDAAIISTLSTGDLDDALTNWDKTGFALTTAQHDLVGARVSTVLLDNAVAGLSTLDTADLDATVTAIFAKGMEQAGGHTFTFGEFQRIMFAGNAGPSTGGGSGTLSYLSADGVTTRIKAVCDTDGNRSTIAYAGSS